MLDASQNDVWGSEQFECSKEVKFSFGSDLLHSDRLDEQNAACVAPSYANFPYEEIEAAGELEKSPQTPEWVNMDDALCNMQMEVREEQKETEVREEQKEEEEKEEEVFAHIKKVELDQNAAFHDEQQYVEEELNNGI